MLISNKTRLDQRPLESILYFAFKIILLQQSLLPYTTLSCSRIRPSSFVTAFNKDVLKKIKYRCLSDSH